MSKPRGSMIGKQVLPDKPGPSLTLEGLVPQDNFYRRLKPLLDLNFLYAAIAPYYGKCGQQSIDPVVFRSGGPVQIATSRSLGEPHFRPVHYSKESATAGYSLLLGLLGWSVTSLAKGCPAQHAIPHSSTASRIAV